MLSDFCIAHLPFACKQHDSCLLLTLIWALTHAACQGQYLKLHVCSSLMRPQIVLSSVSYFNQYIQKKICEETGFATLTLRSILMDHKAGKLPKHLARTTQ